MQFDYIRYPDWRPFYGHTDTNESRFRDAHGKGPIEESDPAWQDWKRAQVTALLRELGAQARSLRPGLRVSTTGLVPYSRASLEASQDWKAWVGEGLVDFVTLMAYSPEPAQFERYLADARGRLGSLDRVNFAVGAYAICA